MRTEGFCGAAAPSTSAFDGNLHLANPAVRTHPIRPGLTFHELRHSHKTWLIAAGIPKIAQARRLGHRLDRRVVEVYSHVADEVETPIQKALKQAWLDARHTIANHPTPPPVTPRDGCIRRHLRDNGLVNPAGIITGPPPSRPNGWRRPAQTSLTPTRSKIKYGAARPRFTHIDQAVI
jgi:Phage integrase family